MWFYTDFYKGNRPPGGIQAPCGTQSTGHGAAGSVFSFTTRRPLRGWRSARRMAHGSRREVYCSYFVYYPYLKRKGIQNLCCSI